MACLRPHFDWMSWQVAAAAVAAPAPGGGWTVATLAIAVVVAVLGLSPLAPAQLLDRRVALKLKAAVVA